MPQGKAAGLRCIQLTEDNRCAIFASPLRPAVCAGLQAAAEMCGNSPAEAMHWLTRLEHSTAP